LKLWWELVIVLVVLKIPVFYVGWVIWWAIRAVPELGADGGSESVNWTPWRRPSPSGSPARPGRGAPDRSRPRERARAARRQSRMGGAGL
jgi:hypothetical protein